MRMLSIIHRASGEEKGSTFNKPWLDVRVASLRTEIVASHGCESEVRNGGDTERELV
jgi:hypothetical protein